jgi:hypothetical protein
VRHVIFLCIFRSDNGIRGQMFLARLRRLVDTFDVAAASIAGRSLTRKRLPS